MCIALDAHPPGWPTSLASAKQEVGAFGWLGAEFPIRCCHRDEDARFPWKPDTWRDDSETSDMRDSCWWGQASGVSDRRQVSGSGMAILTFGHSLHDSLTLPAPTF